MNEVTVKTKWLLDIMSANMEKHINEHAQAMDDYKAAQLKALENATKYFRKHGSFPAANNPFGVGMQVLLSPPQSNAADYQIVIDMLSASTKEEQTLTTDEFRRYVNDDWKWKGQLAAQSTFYNSISGKTR